MFTTQSSIYEWNCIELQETQLISMYLIDFYHIKCVASAVPEF